MAIPLHERRLREIPDRVTVPRYERRGLEPNVAHIGVGSFHRAHQAVYLDDLLQLQDSAERWSECGIGLLPSDAKMGSVLESQQGLYTLVTRDRDAETARVVGSIVRYIHAFATREAALELLANPKIRMVTLTITEGGYFVDEGSGRFREEAAPIRSDLADPSAPGTAIGYLAEALARRHAKGVAPFTVLSCDNLQHNGDLTRNVLIHYASLRDAALARWIESEVAFPNCMVDRITPATTENDRESLCTRFGVEDAWPVVCEPFRQWVVEDRFPQGRPRWEELGPESGIQLTDDVTGYEKLKMRLLNGGHSAIAYLGVLLGYSYVHEAIEDPRLRHFVTIYMEQVSPVVPPLPGIDAASYKRSLIERFSNPSIGDQLTRVASEGSAKLTKWTMPVAAELIDKGLPFESVAMVVAAWFCYLGGRNEKGRGIDVLDERKNELTRLSKDGEAGLERFLQEPTLFSERLRSSQEFAQCVRRTVHDLTTNGVYKALSAIVFPGPPAE